MFSYCLILVVPPISHSHMFEVHLLKLVQHVVGVSTVVGRHLCTVQTLDLEQYRNKISF